jgi:DNA-binding LacI/PurR family transcriptional regulator
MSTIQDVAAKAGVSVSTVSNVLNNREARMRPETLARVHQAIADLSFRPNHSARMLKTGRIPMIGLMVPSIANPYFGVLARWVEESARAQGYGVLLCNTYRDAEREKEYAQAFMAQGIKGVILGSALQANEHLVPLVEQGLAAVSLDRTSAADGPLRDFVSVDNHQAAVLVMEHLIGQGHRHITFVGASVQSLNRVARLEGARAACERLGAELNVVVGSGFGGYDESEMAEIGQMAARSLVQDNCPSTAYVGVNDMLAVGLLAGLQQSGLKVPTDVSVMGIDGIYLGAYVSPALSTVHQPMQDIAAAAVEHVISRMNQPQIESRVSIFPPTLVIRGSTGPARGVT